MNNLFIFTQLPPVTCGVGITTEPLEEDENFNRRCVLLVKECIILDFMSTLKL